MNISLGTVFKLGVFIACLYFGEHWATTLSDMVLNISMNTTQRLP